MLVMIAVTSPSAAHPAPGAAPALSAAVKLQVKALCIYDAQSSPLAHLNPYLFSSSSCIFSFLLPIPIYSSCLTASVALSYTECTLLVASPTTLSAALTASAASSNVRWTNEPRMFRLIVISSFFAGASDVELASLVNLADEGDEFQV